LTLGTPGVYYNTNGILVSIDYFNSTTTKSIITIGELDLGMGTYVNNNTVTFDSPLPESYRGKEVFARQAMSLGQPTLLRIENIGGGEDGIEVDGTLLDFSDGYAVNVPVVTGQELTIRPIPNGDNDYMFGQTSTTGINRGINIEGERGMLISNNVEEITILIPPTDLDNNPVTNSVDWGKATISFTPAEFEISFPTIDDIPNQAQNAIVENISLNFTVISPPQIEGFGPLAANVPGELPTLIGLGEADIQLQEGQTTITVEQTLLPKTFTVETTKQHNINTNNQTFITTDIDPISIRTITIEDLAPTDSVIPITLDLTATRDIVDEVTEEVQEMEEETQQEDVTIPDPEPDLIPGCTDTLAINYNSLATIDDGTCQYDSKQKSDKNLPRRQKKTRGY